MLQVFSLSRVVNVEVVFLTRVKLLGDAAHLFTVVRGHSWTTSLVFSSTLITDSLVMPRSRGTSLFLLFIFSCEGHVNRILLRLENIQSWQLLDFPSLTIRDHLAKTVTEKWSITTTSVTKRFSLNKYYSFGNCNGWFYYCEGVGFFCQFKDASSLCCEL